jgi:hypothetical protein
MIRPLRRAHRAVVTTLAVLLPVLVVAGLAARREVPASMESMRLSPRPATREEETPGVIVRWEKRLERLPAPDVLVYWSREPVAGSELPRDAVLLGRFVPGVLPRPASRSAGYLILYSLARREVLDTARLGGQP